MLKAAWNPRRPGVLQRLLPARIRSNNGSRICTAIGPGAIFEGRPRIDNEGQITIGSGFRMSSLPVPSHLVTDRGASIVIGDEVTIGHGSGLASKRHIEIGGGTTLGAFVLVMDTDYHVPGNFEAQAPSSPIVVGRNVWIGNNVTILRGSKLGDGAVVFDGSVVTGEVEAGARVSGVPARLVPSATDAQLARLGSGYPERTIAAAMRAFRLSWTPRLTTSPGDIPGWDSLGTLSFILALEDEFSVVINEEDMTHIRSLADVVAMLKRKSENANSRLA